MEGKASTTSFITKFISEAVRVRKPKTRYIGGKFAKPMVWMRKHLGDRFFDKLLMSQIKNFSK